MPVLNTEKALRSLRKTPVILDAFLRDLSSERARTATDGPDGWSVLFVMCHLNDYETIYTERVRMMLDQERPTFPNPLTNDQLVAQNDYANQDVHQIFEAYLDKRRVYLTLLENLTDAQWARPGVHPSTGDTTVLEFAINTALHDLNHIEQIVRALGLADSLL
jgi:DinB family protein